MVDYFAHSDGYNLSDKSYGGTVDSPNQPYSTSSNRYNPAAALAIDLSHQIFSSQPDYEPYDADSCQSAGQGVEYLADSDHEESVIPIATSDYNHMHSNDDNEENQDKEDTTDWDKLLIVLHSFIHLSRFLFNQDGSSMDLMGMV